MEKSKDLEDVSKLISGVFLFLEKDFLYQKAEKMKKDEVFMEWFSVEFANTGNHRRISVDYTKSLVYDKIVHAFGVSIIRTPYTRIEDFFSLSNYLESLGINYSTNIEGVFNKIRAEEILMTIANDLKKHAYKIIDGSMWLESYYPRKD